MNNPTMMFQFTFVADGTSDEITVDVSLAPFNANFAGNLPQGIILPVVNSTATGPLDGVTATLSGTEITLSFPTPPPADDGNGNQIVYSASFYLEFSGTGAVYTGINFNQAQPLVGSVG